MAGKVTVEDAIKKGNRMLKYPTTCIFIALLLASFIGAIALKLHPFTGILAGFILGGGLASLYSSIMTTRWRIWAFGNVDNVHELQRAAITEQLINEENSWKEKLEIRSTSDVALLADIKRRLDEEKNFIDDPGVANVTLIFNSYIEWSLGGWLLILLGVVTGYFISWFTLIILIPAAGILYKAYTRSKEDAGKAVITINNNGIGTFSADFNTWSEIENEKISYVSSGRSGSYRFTYDYPGGKEDINLNFLKIKPYQLNHLLYIYRNRYLNAAKRLNTTSATDTQ
jgi:hypothetical protein